MPHPERASESVLVFRNFRSDGRIIFESLVYSLKRGW